MWNLLRKIWRKLRYYRERGHELGLCLKEFRSNGRGRGQAKESAFKNAMLLQAHRVEKGLGLRDCAPGHSASVAINLLQRMNEYLDSGYDISAFAFQETYAIFYAYLMYQKEFGSPDWKPLQTLEEGHQQLLCRIGEETAGKLLASCRAGAETVALDTLNSGKHFDFDGFIRTRHSMRMYENRPVSMEDMQRAIQMANKAPSACNRQPVYVYFASEPEKVEKIDELITGSNGFKGQTANYLIVTVDRAQFSGEEQFQWYINGGIYLSFLTLALHSLGIGSCIMQWKAFHQNQAALKKMAGITGNEAIVAIVGCGYYAADTRCICAQRKPVSETLRTI